MKKNKLKSRIKEAAYKVLSGDSKGEEIFVKFYKNGTDQPLIEKTLDVFLSELEETLSGMDEDNSENEK